MFNRGHFGTGQKGATGLEPQAETLPFKIPPRNIQEGDNTQEYKKDRKYTPLYHLSIWEVPQEAMEGKKVKYQAG